MGRGGCGTDTFNRLNRKISEIILRLIQKVRLVHHLPQLKELSHIAIYYIMNTHESCSTQQSCRISERYSDSDRR